jgi:hypothetical protein
MRRCLRSDQDEPADAAWIAQRHSLGKKGSRRSADEGGFFDANRLHKGVDIGGVVMWRVAALRFI